MPCTRLGSDKHKFYISHRFDSTSEPVHLNRAIYRNGKLTLNSFGHPVPWDSDHVNLPARCCSRWADMWLFETRLQIGGQTMEAAGPRTFTWMTGNLSCSTYSWLWVWILSPVPTDALCVWLRIQYTGRIWDQCQLIYCRVNYGCLPTLSMEWHICFVTIID